jgi:hypothetical protein
MKPTRNCNWPPRLDVVLRTSTLSERPPPRLPRAWRPVDVRLRRVAGSRWPGRPAKQRRFDLALRPPA